jgi:ABC-type transporter Mla maintaining outer membrane lipid asymmetry ATPase subunit MlaF
VSWGFELIDVSKREGRRVVLDGADLGARMGLVTAVLGPSGTGKTMMFRLLAGLEKPDTGAVLVAGHDISRLRGGGRKKLQRRMSVVFQGAEAGLFGGLTVRENVQFPMRAAGRVPARRLDAVAGEELTRFGLAHLADAFPVDLGPAQRRCLALARAVALRAPLVLVDGLDEHLDPDTLRAVCAILREESHSRAGTWLVTVRDPAVAGLVADEVVEVTHAERSSAVMRR